MPSVWKLRASRLLPWLPDGRCLCFTKTHDFQRLREIIRQIAGHARDARRP